MRVARQTLADLRARSARIGAEPIEWAVALYEHLLACRECDLADFWQEHMWCRMWDHERGAEVVVNLCPVAKALISDEDV